MFVPREKKYFGYFFTRAKVQVRIVWTTDREAEIENKRFLSNHIFRDGLGKIMCTLTLTCVHIENF